MSRTNPFSPFFGVIPACHIENSSLQEQVLSEFNSAHPAWQSAVITGARASGKTVLLTRLCEIVKARPEWIVVSVFPDQDILQYLSCELAKENWFEQFKQTVGYNIQLSGLTVNIHPDAPVIQDSVFVLKDVISFCASKGKKVLIALDEVTGNEHVRALAVMFQACLQEGLPVFLLMTGLYENLTSLQNDDELAIIYEAQIIRMTPLNLKSAAQKYQRLLDLDPAAARDMAILTRGYAYAFQLLGYLCCKHQRPYTEVLDDLDEYLEENVYEKIWSELSRQDWIVLKTVMQSESHDVPSIMEFLKIDDSNFSASLFRLSCQGILDISQRGFVKLILPRFDVFLQNHLDWEDEL